MSRSKWKCPYVDFKLLESLKNYKTGKAIFTKSRNSIIIPMFVNKTINDHNGKTYQKLSITEEMISYKLGEFVPTRKNFSFKKKK
jgi:ribosomal protein S19